LRHQHFVHLGPGDSAHLRRYIIAQHLDNQARAVGELCVLAPLAGRGDKCSEEEWEKKYV